ncbi:MAG: ankyrin repeat domain-containing protein [Akkermansiaceae bacterium]|nr:ankyrin repeat domain-containing protein [Akkermansiaceae bacterium]
MVALAFAATRAIAGPAPESFLEPAFRLTPGAANEPVSLRWVGGWMLAQVRINGADAGWFKIATAWDESAIAPEVAAKLKLPVVPVAGLVDPSLFAHSSRDQLPGKYFRVDGLQCGPALATDIRFRSEDFSSMSQQALEIYGEGISGALGWDLLKTLPFLLDEPGLQLVWQPQAQPPEAAVPLPVTETDGKPFIEITLGNGCKTPALVNSTGLAVCIQQAFMRAHAAKLAIGPTYSSWARFFVSEADDDALPVAAMIERWPSDRWLEVECGGLKQTLPSIVSPLKDPALGEVQICYGLLRRTKALFDGPGRTLWLKPAAWVPEVALVAKDRPVPSPRLLAAALESAILFNDPVAVKALAAAGADLKGLLPDQTPLAVAVSVGAREAALALIAAGAPVAPASNQADTPLLAACGNGDAAMVKLLLKKGADANRATAPSLSPLMMAARSGNPAVVAALRGKARFPTDPGFAGLLMCEAAIGGNLSLAKEMLALLTKDRMPREGWKMLLEQALLLGREEVVDWVLETGGAELVKEGAELRPLLAAILPTRVEKTDAIRERLVTRLLAAGADPNATRKGVTPLLLAARHGNETIVKALLAAGAKATATDLKSRNALHRAAAANQPAAVILPLLKRGLDLDEEDPTTEMTALNTYAQHGNPEASAALLEAGASPNESSSFGMPPLVAATNGLNSTDDAALAVVNLLFKHGARIDDKAGGYRGPVALFGAICASRSTLIKPLVNGGAPVNGKMACKLTPLELAAAIATAETVSALLDCGAEPNATDSNGMTPLAHAAAAGNIANLARLLERGVPPDAATPEAIPPLQVAAATGQLRAVRALLAAGADPGAVNPASKTTALEAARSRGDQAMVELLENPPRNR